LKTVSTDNNTQANLEMSPDVQNPEPPL